MTIKWWHAIYKYEVWVYEEWERRGGGGGKKNQTVWKFCHVLSCSPLFTMFASVLIIFLRIIIIENGRSQMQKLYKITKRQVERLWNANIFQSVRLFIISYSLVCRFFFLCVVVFLVLWFFSVVLTAHVVVDFINTFGG